jgi:hypothetical protein
MSFYSGCRRSPSGSARRSRPSRNKRSKYVGDYVSAAIGEARLESGKIGAISVVKHDRLAVDEGVAAFQLGDVVGDRPKFLGPVQPLAGSNLGFALIDHDEMR